MVVYEATRKTEKTAVKPVPPDIPLPRKAKFWIQSLLLRGLWFYCRRLSPEKASDLGARVIRRIAPRLQKYQKVIRNYKVVFPEKSEAEIRDLALGSMETLGRVIAEYAHLNRVMGAELEERVEFVAKDSRSVFEPDRKPAVFIAAHQANWEMFAAASSRLGGPLAIVSTPRPNYFIEAMLGDIRAKNNFVVIDKEGAMRNIVRNMRKGTSIGILADHRFEDGEMVPFFGRDARTVVGTARLAHRLGYELIPARIERTGPVKFRITTYPPIEPESDLASDQDKAVNMMVQVNRIFEDWIRERPEQWVCTKRRWPNENTTSRV